MRRSRSSSRSASTPRGWSPPGTASRCAGTPRSGTTSTLIAAALLSLRIAAASATLALIVGTLAGYALARFGRFRSRGASTAALAAPLVLPEVITGLSLLLLFVALQQASAGRPGAAPAR